MGTAKLLADKLRAAVERKRAQMKIQQTNDSSSDDSDSDS